MNNCLDCIKTNIGTNSTSSAKDRLSDDFLGFLNYCDSTRSQIQIQTFTYTALNGDVTTQLAMVGIVTASVNSTASSATAPPSSNTAPPTAPAGSSSQSIAGPVAGSIGGAFLLALLIAGGLLFHRRRTRAKQAADPFTYEKAQLHSDHMPRDAFGMHEMEAWQPPGELAAAEPVRLAELPACEVAAHEMHDNSAPSSQPATVSAPGQGQDKPLRRRGDPTAQAAVTSP